MKQPKLTHLAKNLRSRQTDAEIKLWINLRARRLNGVKFRRQQPIGNYIVDFISFESKLIIEVDGGQHSESPGLEKDRERTLYLEAEGFQLLRFWDNDILNNIEGVKSEVYMALENKIKLERESPSL